MGIYERKHRHIQDQIKFIEGSRADGNDAQVDAELAVQQWRLDRLEYYGQMDQDGLLAAQEGFRKAMPAELWEQRKRPVLGLLSKHRREQVMELAIVELLLGEYEGV